MLSNSKHNTQLQHLSTFNKRVLAPGMIGANQNNMGQIGRYRLI
jgi:hypothetical protein